MADLDAYRAEIDDIDKRLVELIDRRMEIARAIGAAKAQAGSPPFHAGRHHAVIEAAVQRSTGNCPPEGLRLIFRELLSVSLNLQKPLHVAYLGPIATYTYYAALERFGTSVDYRPCDNITDIFRAVEKGSADYGVVPIENSTGGMVNITLDCFAAFDDVRICAEVYMPIRHSLLSRVERDRIKVIFAHQQSFAQCANWLGDHLPHAQHREVASNVQGILEAMRTPESAAIASADAGAHFGLEVRDEHIEDTNDNTTRFLVISNADATAEQHNKTSLMFSVRDEPGALFSMLKPFAKRDLNLTKIESHPTRRQAWEYMFFVDVDGHRNDPIIAEALEELRPLTDWFRVLGSYPRQLHGLSLDAVRQMSADEPQKLS